MLVEALIGCVLSISIRVTSTTQSFANSTFHTIHSIPMKQRHAFLNYLPHLYHHTTYISA